MSELLGATEGIPLLVVAAVFFFAGFVKGVVGLGLPTVSVAILAQLMTPAAAAGLLLVPSLLTNVWQTRPVHTLGPLLRRLAPMQLALVAGTLATAAILGAPAGNWARVALGVALVAYAAWGLTGAHLTLDTRRERLLGPVFGAATGAVTAATGSFVMPAVPYLQALGLPRVSLVQAMGVSFTVSTIALAIGLGSNAALPLRVLATSTLMLLPSLLGMSLGQWLGERMSPAFFRLLLLWALALLGAQMLVRAV